MKNKAYFLHILIFLLAINCFADNGGGADERAAKFENYQLKNYQETVFIHVDKRYYLSGEFLKFKVYCLERNTSRPSALSKVAYVEVLDSEHNPQLQTRIELKDGTGTGEFYIPINMLSGNFVIRGYTRWMRNFSPEYYYHSMVQIINPFKVLGLKPPSKANHVDFYPEGGNLLHGVNTKVVFHAKNELGVPTDIKGRLMANDTIIVSEFSSLKNGLGSFHFTPDLTMKYHVELKSGDEYLSQEFIPIESRGFNAQLKQIDGDNQLAIFCNEPGIVQPSDEISVLVHKKGEMLLKKDLQMNKGQVKMTIDNSLIEGVVSISILSSDGDYLWERKVFGAPKSTLEKHISLISKSLKSREKVEIDLSDFKKSSALSISVSATHTYFENHLLGLDQYLMLDNSLKIVSDLEKYFGGTPDEDEVLINNLLIAYPANKNENLFSGIAKKQSFIPEHRSVLVTGKLLNKKTKEPAFGILTYLSVPGKITQIYADKSRKDGGLVFEAGNFYGSQEIVVQNNYTKDSIYTIEIDNPYSREYADITMPVFNIDEDLADLIRQKSQYMQVQNANMTLTTNSEIISMQDSASFYLEPDAKYYLDDYTRFIVMEEVMREYVSGVNVRKNKDGFHFMVIDMERNLVYNDNPLMLLDGVPVFDADEIIALDPLKIEKIETVKTRFGRGVLDAQGIVTYTSYAGDLAGYKLNEKARVFEYDGIQPKKAYFYPSYANAYERKNTTPDFRSTLYWDPELKLDQQDQQMIEFYASDDADTYEVRINGMTEEGKPFSLIETFKVTMP